MVMPSAAGRIEAVEDVLDPALPIIDPHHHVWVRESSRYMIDELVADLTSGHNLSATVYIEGRAMYRRDGPEAMRPAGEVEFAAGIGAIGESGFFGQTHFCAGIVGYADFRIGAAVEELFAAEVSFGNGRLRGVRQQATWDPDNKFSRRELPAHLLMDARFREGFAKLSSFGLSYDSWQYHPQLPELLDLARAFPQTTIIVGHTGGPIGIGTYKGRRAEVFPVWWASMRELAECPNVFVKLGGLGMPLCGFGFDRRSVSPSSRELAEAWAPYIEACIEAFGPQRCMFESNFPVDKPSCSYRTLWNAFKLLTATSSPDEKAALFRGTAARVYRLA